jgi:methyl-accepting chemotaxis protein
MGRHWTLGQRLAAGFAVIVLLAAILGAVGVFALSRTVTNKDEVITVDGPRLVDAERLRTAVERKGGAIRAYLLGRDEAFVTVAIAAHEEFGAIVARLTSGAPKDLAAKLEVIRLLELDHEAAQAVAIKQRQADAAPEVLARTFAEVVVPKRAQLDAAVRDFITLETTRLEAARTDSNDEASFAIALLIALAVAVALVGTVLAVVLGRATSRQITGAVAQVQSSSAELQSAASQQATGSREQATAMNEITTTISELLATSRQIADSAQRVAQIAGQTAGSARTGDGTVATAQETIAAIRRQTDQVVSHMLVLGTKSQEIGAVLDIVSELAEQTNILAINATIEAAGAGDAGKRFGVVADEIRKLADRVTGSTKQVRTLIDDVRSAVNTTVMATEAGSKSVDAGSKQFGEVTAAFKQIASLVVTTTEAAREIELSTKQQTTAVEQVNVAIANVAQATKENEASSGQTLATASQLATMSKDLLRLVQTQPN